MSQGKGIVKMKKKGSKDEIRAPKEKVSYGDLAFRSGNPGMDREMVAGHPDPGCPEHFT